MHAIENTNKVVNQLLDYVATYPNDGVTYRASKMVLAAHSNASFLMEQGSCSRAGAHIFLSKDEPIPCNNGPILTISQIIKFVMASAAEAELAGLYITAREMIPLKKSTIGGKRYMLDYEHGARLVYGCSVMCLGMC